MVIMASLLMSSQLEILSLFIIVYNSILQPAVDAVDDYVHYVMGIQRKVAYVADELYYAIFHVMEVYGYAEAVYREMIEVVGGLLCQY